MTTPTPTLARVRAALNVLVGLSGAMIALAIFQWVELVQVRHGGQALCSVNATVNCETVWNSAFAGRVHHWLGVPVAGLGLIWGLSALVLSLRLRARVEDAARRGAVRLLGMAGVAGCVVFAVASFQSGALCLTCVGTYVLVLAFAGVALFALPGRQSISRAELRPALLWAGGLAIGFYLLVLAPGLATPEGSSAQRDLAKADVPAGTAPSGEDSRARLVNFLGRLGPSEAQALSDALGAYRQNQVPMQALGFPARALVGSASAPMKVLEFTDILCGHCRHLEETMRELRRVLPPGAMSVESRYFPLDGECNPSVTHVGTNGVRCAGAKAQLCLEGAPDFPALREKMFAEQETLTVQRVMEIAASGSVSRGQLEACMNAPETSQKLQDDIRYALVYNLEGTPLVVVNGKQAFPTPAFLYVMGLSGGNPDAPELRALPPPRASP